MSKTIPTKPKSKRKLFLALGGIFLFLFLIVIVISLKSSKKIEFENFHEIMSTTIDTSGGEIIVEENNTSITGFKIAVPQNAYTEPINFTISEAKITSHNYGRDFEPITPIIKINNGNVFSNLPLLVTIPIELDADEFAMGFYYDEETGELEGIPFVELNQDSIVLLTNHFSNIVVSKVKVGRIVENIDTGFKVQRHNIQTPNYGTYLRNGHCAGQAIAEMYYYYNRGRIGWDKPLYGRLDNNGQEKTPDLWEDDSLLLRLSAVLQNKYAENWVNPDHSELNSYHDNFSKNDERTYYAIVYAMQVTKNPQFIAVATSNTGHALTAYKVADGEIYVADPNYPKDANRTISLKRKKDKPPKFSPYYSGANAQEAESGSVAYTRFGYYGVFALIDKQFVAEKWLEVKNTKSIGGNLFPQDVTVEIAVGMDEKKQFITGNIQDGINPDTDGTLFVRLPNPKEDEEISLYHGPNFITVLSNEWKGVKLKEGDNSIGIYHAKDRWGDHYSFVNFNRYNIINTEKIVEEVEEIKETANYQNLVGNWHFEGTLTDHITPEKYGEPNNSIFLDGNIYVENNQVYITFVDLEDLLTEPVPVNINGDRISFVLEGIDKDEFKLIFQFSGRMHMSDGELKFRGEGSTEAWDTNNEYGYSKYDFIVYKYPE